jgi:hypothetical protein
LVSEVELKRLKTFCLAEWVSEIACDFSVMLAEIVCWLLLMVAYPLPRNRQYPRDSTPLAMRPLRELVLFARIHALVLLPPETILAPVALLEMKRWIPEMKISTHLCDEIGSLTMRMIPKEDYGSIYLPKAVLALLKMTSSSLLVGDFEWGERL